TLLDMMARRMDPELFRLSRDYVGDTAETIALVWSTPTASRAGTLTARSSAVSDEAGRAPAPPPRLSEIVSELALIGRNDLAPRLEAWLDQLDATGRWALLKVLTGALRVGVSARLAKAAVAEMAGLGVDDIEQIWHSLTPPYAPLLAWLEGRAAKPDIGRALVFRPLMLSHALEAA